MKRKEKTINVELTRGEIILFLDFYEGCQVDIQEEMEKDGTLEKLEDALDKILERRETE